MGFCIVLLLAAPAVGTPHIAVDRFADPQGGFNAADSVEPGPLCE